MKLKLKIEKVICHRNGLLIVFYTPAHCWQFCCLDRSGKVFKSCDIFYTPWAAEVEGRRYGDLRLKF